MTPTLTRRALAAVAAALLAGGTVVLGVSAAAGPAGAQEEPGVAQAPDSAVDDSGVDPDGDGVVGSGEPYAPEIAEITMVEDPEVAPVEESGTSGSDAPYAPEIAETTIEGSASAGDDDGLPVAVGVVAGVLIAAGVGLVLVRRART